MQFPMTGQRYAVPRGKNLTSHCHLGILWDGPFVAQQGDAPRGQGRRYQKEGEAIDSPKGFRMLTTILPYHDVDVEYASCNTIPYGTNTRQLVPFIQPMINTRNDGERP